MGNCFMMLKKPDPRVNQYGSPSVSAIHALMLKVFWFNILQQKQSVNAKK